MTKRKRKLSTKEKAEKKKRRREYMTVFMHGKQKRVKRPVLIDGMDEDEFIRNNADPIWLLQNEMYEELHQYEMEENGKVEPPIHRKETPRISDDNELPF